MFGKLNLLVEIEPEKLVQPKNTQINVQDLNFNEGVLTTRVQDDYLFDCFHSLCQLSSFFCGGKTENH